MTNVYLAASEGEGHFEHLSYKLVSVFDRERVAEELSLLLSVVSGFNVPVDVFDTPYALLHDEYRKLMASRPMAMANGVSVDEWFYFDIAASPPNCKVGNSGLSLCEIHEKVSGRLTMFSESVFCSFAGTNERTTVIVTPNESKTVYRFVLTDDVYREHYQLLGNYPWSAVYGDGMVSLVVDSSDGIVSILNLLGMTPQDCTESVNIDEFREIFPLACSVHPSFPESVRGSSDSFIII